MSRKASLYLSGIAGLLKQGSKRLTLSFKQMQILVLYPYWQGGFKVAKAYTVSVTVEETIKAIKESELWQSLEGQGKLVIE